MRRGRTLARPPMSGRAAGLWLLGGCFAAGGVLGLALAWQAEPDSLGEYLRQYFSTAAQGEAVLPHPISVLARSLRWPLAAFLLGLSGVGAGGLPLLFALRGFFLYCAAGLFVRALGAPGAAAALVTLGPGALVGVPVLFVLGGMGWERAARRAGLLSPERNAWPDPRARVGAVYALCTAVLLMAAILEYTCMVPLLERAAEIVA